MTTVTPDRRQQARSDGPVVPVIGARARRKLLDIARETLRVATGKTTSKELSVAIQRGLQAETRAAVFVTLTKAGVLRGCMGTLDPGQRLEEAVAATTITAARADPRFLPVEAAELPAIRVDISVLGAPVELDDPAEFVPGVHGVIVERDGRRALLLPEVATDHGWDGEQMLKTACEKAGLRSDAWQDPRTTRYVFRTVRFGGPAAGIREEGSSTTGCRRTAVLT
jgi:AmmeMemoRadiSam system protein A